MGSRRRESEKEVTLQRMYPLAGPEVWKENLNLSLSSLSPSLTPESEEVFWEPKEEASVPFCRWNLQKQHIVTALLSPGHLGTVSQADSPCPGGFLLLETCLLIYPTEKFYLETRPSALLIL